MEQTYTVPEGPESNRDTAACLLAIVTRTEDRVFEAPHRMLTELLTAVADGAPGPAADFETGWRKAVHLLLTSPDWYWAVLSGPIGRVEEHRVLARSFSNAALAPPDHQPLIMAARGRWTGKHGSLTDESSALRALVRYLSTLDFSTLDREQLRSYFAFKDLLYGCLVNPSWAPLQERIMRLFRLQMENWQGSYCAGYAYQGYAAIGISGAKPTEERLARFDIAGLLRLDARVLVQAV